MARALCRKGQRYRSRVDSFSKEEVNGSTKFNYAKNTLDKDNGTVWAADDGAVLAGDYKGDGEYIIYDLGGIRKEEMIRVIAEDMESLVKKILDIHRLYKKEG